MFKIGGEIMSNQNPEKMKALEAALGQIEKQLGIVLAADEHSFGIQLNNKVWLGVWDGYDSENYLP